MPAETLDARQFLVGQVESRRRANQGRLGLDEVRALDRIEGLVLLNVGAKFNAACLMMVPW